MRHLIFLFDKFLPMPAIHRLTDFQSHLLGCLGTGDGIPINQAGADKDRFEAEAFQMPAVPDK